MPGLASLLDPTCGVPSINYVDDPLGAAKVAKCARTNGMIGAWVFGAIAALLAVLSFSWTQSDGNGGQQPVIPLAWIVLPMLLAAASLVLSPWVAAKKFGSDQLNFRSSGMGKADWIRLRTQQQEAAQQAAAISGAGFNIASALVSGRH